MNNAEAMVGLSVVDTRTGEITGPVPQLSLFEGEMVDEHVYKVKGFETTIYEPLKRGAT